MNSIGKILLSWYSTFLKFYLLFTMLHWLKHRRIFVEYNFDSCGLLLQVLFSDNGRNKRLIVIDWRARKGQKIQSSWQKFNYHGENESPEYFHRLRPTIFPSKRSPTSISRAQFFASNHHHGWLTIRCLCTVSKDANKGNLHLLAAANTANNRWWHNLDNSLIDGMGHTTQPITLNAPIATYSPPLPQKKSW